MYGKEIFRHLVFYNEDDDESHWDISYNLGKQYWGNGYITEAMKEVIWFAENELGMEKCVTAYAKVNTSSANVLHKLGFIEQVWWIIRIGIPLVIIEILIAIITILIKRYGTTIIKKGINRWNGSLSVVILTVFVYFGDYVKKLTEFNFIGMWMIADVVLIGMSWYKYGGDENRDRR